VGYPGSSSRLEFGEVAATVLVYLLAPSLLEAL
jgi:hypothetical protein